MRTETPSVLLVYTGGTIGMIENPETDALENFDFDHLLEHIPELKRSSYRISSCQFDPSPDSSDMEPTYWVKLVKIINHSYDYFDGFIIPHGTGTMAYAASALSLMFESLNKPVIFAGSQLPIGTLCTGGEENLITAIEIAAAKNPNSTAIIPEACVFFKNHLMRGSHTTKIDTKNFNAFYSFNYSPLTRVDIHTKYESNLIRKPDPTKPLKPHYLLGTNVVILALFPGIQESTVTFLLHVPGLKVVTMKASGSGNTPQEEWLIRQLKEIIGRGTIIVNTTQCASGVVEAGRYKTGMHLLEAGVISRHDSTPECAITKLMFLLGHGLPSKDI